MASRAPPVQNWSLKELDRAASRLEMRGLKLHPQIQAFYQLANEEGNTYRMITLEILIVLLFVVDLLLLFFFEFR